MNLLRHALMAALGLALVSAGRLAGAETVDLHGTVSDQTTGAPISGATVIFKGEYLAQGEHSATSDRNGAFQIPRVPAGRYLVESNLEGYLLADEWRGYVTVTAGGADRPLTVKLARETTVSGLVVDEDGAPVSDVEVVLADVRAEAGNVMARSIRSVAAPNGRFQFDKITPGRYFLHARSDGFLATWFPGTSDVLAAAPVTVTAGADLAGLRIKMRRGVLHTVSGKVEGVRAERSLTVYILTAADPASTQPVFVPNGPVRAPGSHLNEDGTFAVPGVAEGPAIVWIKRPTDPGPVATTSILVGGADVDNVRVFVPPPVSFAGRLVYADGRKWKHRGYQFSLASLGLGGIRKPVDVADDGTFEAHGLTEGTYRLLIGNDSEFVAKVDFAERSIEGSRFDLSAPGSERVVVTLSGEGAALEGLLEGTFTADSPAHGLVSVIQKPASPLELTTERSAPVLPDGSFLLEKLAPGEYRVCAWREDAEPRGIMTHPRYQEKLEHACSTVTLKAGEHGQVKSRQVSAAEIER